MTIDALNTLRPSIKEGTEVHVRVSPSPTAGSTDRRVVAWVDIPGVMTDIKLVWRRGIAPRVALNYVLGTLGVYAADTTEAESGSGYRFTAVVTRLAQPVQT